MSSACSSYSMTMLTLGDSHQRFKRYEGYFGSGGFQLLRTWVRVVVGDSERSWPLDAITFSFGVGGAGRRSGIIWCGVQVKVGRGHRGFDGTNWRDELEPKMSI